MANITLRETKGSPLSFSEMDGNLTSLNNGKLEIIENLEIKGNMNVNTDYIAVYDSSGGENKKMLSSATAFFNRTLIIKVIADSLPTYVGDGISRITMPVDLNGLSLSSVGAHVYTAGTGSTTIVQIHNQTDGVDMLSTALYIDPGEVDSSTATTAAVINPSNSTVATADVLRFDIDQIASTSAANGLELRLEFKN